MPDLPALPGQTPSSIASYGALRGDREHRLWIAGAIATLLANYWERDEPAPVAAALGKQWADDLEAFPQAAIAAAVNEWRRNETRRPTPAEIIRLCGKHTPKPRVAEVVPIRSAPRERCSPRRAAEMLAEAGFDREPDLAVLVRRMSRSEAE